MGLQRLEIYESETAFHHVPTVGETEMDKKRERMPSFRGGSGLSASRINEEMGWEHEGGSLIIAYFACIKALFFPELADCIPTVWYTSRKTVGVKSARCLIGRVGGSSRSFRIQSAPQSTETR